MQHEGYSPDAVTFACILKACGSIGATHKGKDVHKRILRRGLLAKDNVLGTALVDMYAKCGSLVDAQEAFDQLPKRDVVSWTALITGYCKHGLGDEALNCFEKMQREGHSPNAMTFACILKACGRTGATEKGREVHVQIVREGLLGKDRVLGSVLVDMYAKCGALAEARAVFEKLPVRDVVSWTGLIEGYCQQGFGEEAISCFKCMEREGLPPDPVVFVSLLKAYQTIGSTNESEQCFEALSTTYGIVPTLEHHTSLVSFYGNQGLFDHAITAVWKMPSSDYLPVWYALMNACQKWGNVSLGRLAFDNAIRLDAKAAIAYVRMSRIYAAAGMHAEVDKIEELRLHNQASHSLKVLTDHERVLFNR
ncbi:hypothetical protein KP509_28G001700 [Ceratopteris richardii]|nr:hypothetical protein KP509_28G001700 [Ceratopteris richardii]